MGSLTSPGAVEAPIVRQFDELAAVYPGLALTQNDSGLWTISGDLRFRATFQETTIEDMFAIELLLPTDYPASPPSAAETGGRIPIDFHKLTDGSFCLGTPLEVRMKFGKTKRLLPFVEDQVVPYLFSFRYFQDHGKMPYGEFSHGGMGILESYQTLLSAENRTAVLELLKTLAYDNYRGHQSCPCGSGARLRHCHGVKVLGLKKAQSADHFLRDIGAILVSLSKEEFAALDRNLLSQDLVTRVKAAMGISKGKGKYG